VTGLTTAIPGKSPPAHNDVIGKGGRVKKAFTWALVAFLIFFVAFSPNSAAHLARFLGSAIGSVANGFASFFSGLV
jgi:hypothetical protein